MAEQKKPVRVEEQAALIAQIVESMRLVWSLLWDSRVSFRRKLIIPGVIIYLLSPLDFIPDWVAGPLGGLDDATVIYLGIRWFINSCPPGVVAEIRRRIRGKASEDRRREIIEGDFREVREDEA